MPVPVDSQWLALSRALTFERGLVASKRPVVIGVVYQSRQRQSERAMEQFRQAVETNPSTGGLRFELVIIDIGDGGRIQQQLASVTCDALYVTPLRAVGIDAISKVSRSLGCMTLSGVPEYVETGLAIGVDMRGDRLQLLVNLTAARHEGAELTAGLLSLARIIE